MDLRTGLILGGTAYLQNLLLPMNLSDVWLGPQLGNLEAVKRLGWLTNDVYALQNLMESFLEFKPLTPQLSSIGIPTMILNGEFDFLTPRALRQQTRVAAFLVSCHGAMARQLALALASQTNAAWHTE